MSKDRQNMISLVEGAIADQDLNSFVGTDRPSTFFFRMGSDAMVSDSIYKDDVIVVDRNIEPESGDYVIANVNGRFMLKQFIDGDSPILCCADENTADIDISSLADFDIFGVVCSVIRKQPNLKNRRFG
ncbi:MAG: LexA family protein [Succinivibrio sp.]